MTIVRQNWCPAVLSRRADGFRVLRRSLAEGYIIADKPRNTVTAKEYLNVLTRLGPSSAIQNL